MKKIQFKTNQNNPIIRAYKDAVEKGKKNQHILPYGDEWAVTNLLSAKADYISSDPQCAIEFAEANATKGTAIFVHGSDGKIKRIIDY